jgi:hypothetical protein
LPTTGEPRRVRDHAGIEAGITDKLWSVEDIVSLVEASEPKSGKRGPYKKADRSVIAYALCFSCSPRTVRATSAA